MEFRRDVPVVVDHLDADHPRRDLADPAPVALDVARQQQHVGQDEVEHHQRPAHPLPAVLRAHPVVRNLFLRVGRVDDQELRERQIRPQHDEGEHELAEVVEVRRVHHPVHRALLREPRQDEDGEGQRRERKAHHVEQAPHGREPVRVDRHRPVDDREGHGQAVDEQAAAREPQHLVGQRGVAGAILFGRPCAQAQRDETPHGEVEDIAADEERHVEVGRLVEDDRVGGGVRPVIEMPHPGEHRQSQHGHRRQGARGGLEDAANHQAPGAAGEMVEHQQREAPEPDAGPVDPGHQIRFVEAVGPGHGEAGAGEHGANDGRDHALRLQARKALGRVVGVRSHV